MRQDKTVQYQPICDTYSVTPLHMRHVQCKTAPYATRSCSAISTHMRHVQCTDTDPCHIRHVYMRDAWW